MSPTTKISPGSTNRAASANINREETPFEALASICSVLVVGLFILTFLAQNYVIPSGSMENTLLVGDHLVVDRLTLMPPASWMPLIRYREPRRGDVVVFFKPVYQPGIDQTDAEGNPQYTHLVKRLIPYSRQRGANFACKLLCICRAGPSRTSFRAKCGGSL